MVTIELKDLRFFAHHGVTEEERNTGNEYIVNLQVLYDVEDKEFNELEDVINYEVLFDIVRKRMMVPTLLLEKVCKSTIRKINHKFPAVHEIIMSIHKLNAPIPYLDGTVGVKMVIKYPKPEKSSKKSKK